MNNSSIYRSNLSNEKIAFLSEIKRNKELNKEDNTPKTYKRQQGKQQKEKELDMLWQGFRTGAGEEKSPGVYLLTGFIAGALCMFVMNSILSIGSNISSEEIKSTAMGQPKYEKKISRKEKIPQINSSVAVISDPIEQTSQGIPSTTKYIVKSGDSMGTISAKFYGKYDPDKIEKIKLANNLRSAHRLSIGQELIIPLD